MLSRETTIAQAQQLYVPTKLNREVHKTQQLAFVLDVLTVLLLLETFALPWRIQFGSHLRQTQ